jgi:tryptophan synthase alpha chain
VRYLHALAAAGADIIELGVPFSDPIADGPVNQASAERALEAGTTLPGILDAVAQYRREGGQTPVVLFSYLNPLLQTGLDTLATRAVAAGVTGGLIVDLPPEEASTWRSTASAHGLETVFLASPTTAPSRLTAVAAASTGFIYYVSRLGVTGAQASLSATLGAELETLRQHVGTKPVGVGFGISTPEQAATVARQADAVVVGSALVKLLTNADPAAAEAQLRELAGSLAAAAHDPSALRSPTTTP